MDCNILDGHFPGHVNKDCVERGIEPDRTTEIHCSTKEQKKLICFHCFKNFPSSDEVLSHIESEHFSFTCNKCLKQFPTDKRLRKHLRDAHLTGKFQCPLCDKIFTRKDHCKDHVYTHSDKPLFRCKYGNCDKVFRMSNNLKQHERIHTAGYRKTCPICDESVVQLSKHLHTHMATKRYPCPSCDKSFTRRGYLLEHEKSHQGEAGFICDECQMEFKSSNVLYKHKRSKHNSERYICEIPECKQEFNRKDNMVSHMKRMHKLVVEMIKSDDPY